MRAPLSFVTGVFLMSLPSSAFAEITLGGWVGLESDSGTSSYKTHLRTNTLLAYQSSDFIIGLGFNNLWSQSSSGLSSNPKTEYVLMSYGPATLTYGSQYGAGNLFPEDYFDFGDTTSISDEVLRLDFSLGTHDFAISNDMNGSSSSEIELGYSGTFGPVDIALGYEADSGQIAALIGRNFEGFGVQFAMVEDTTVSAGPADHAGVTFFVDLAKNVTFGSHVAYVTNGSIGLHSHGFILTFDFNSIRAKAGYEKNHVFGTTDIEIGFVVPFGTPQPSGAARHSLKEYSHRYRP